jgi:hypothetical protein
MQQAIPGFDGGYRLRQDGKFHSFHKHVARSATCL